MICPMISYRNQYQTEIECRREKCAWYNRNKEECCIKCFAENMEDMVEGQRIIFTKEV